MRAVKGKGGLNDPPFFHIIAAVIEGKLFSFSGYAAQPSKNPKTRNRAQSMTTPGRKKEAIKRRLRARQLG
ncbi:MAG: hypothetical protein CXZ00_15240 [Acidobacteria bacterium]|nr:MAG: hypothetical protein CXZ00_15240 [Acidobacteriota bacterium]